ncbi:MAG: DNA-processing protein DprA [Elusimicrobiales bacterium]|nr:DNA-processing protein DprA [Elusimicrobiales bacterium]
MPLSENDKLARIRANSFTWLRTDWLLRMESVCGGAQAVLGRSARELSAEGGISEETAAQFLRESASCDPEGELKKSSSAGARIIFLGEPGYPEALSEIPDPPVLLYVQGNADFSKPAAALVGTRLPTAYGRRVAARLARDLAGCGLAIASGLARGIDSVVHEAALEAGGVTWAVIGTGLGRCYPSENRELARDIAAKGGLVISEYPFDRGPMRHHFPRRNRIIAGLSQATAVIEAPVTSGALITAKLALEQGREVLAVPGPVDVPQSEGPNMLIKEGAGVLRAASDLLDALPSKYMFGLARDAASPAQGLRPAPPSAPLGEDEKAALALVDAGGITLDGMVERLGWPVPRAAAALFELETKTIITCLVGVYSRKL